MHLFISRIVVDTYVFAMFAFYVYIDWATTEMLSSDVLETNEQIERERHYYEVSSLNVNSDIINISSGTSDLNVP